MAEDDLSLRNVDGEYRVIRETADGSEELGPLSVGPFNAEDTLTETLSYDYSENFPSSPRQPEGIGPLTPTPLARANNPVITADDVTDVDDATFVADGFVVPPWAADDGLYHLFFEVQRESGDPDMGHATSHDGESWQYDQLAIENADAHLAFTQPIKYEGQWYILSDNSDNFGGAPLWKATDFPTGWEFEKVALSSDRHEGGIIDPAVFEYGGRWWMLAADNGPFPFEANLYYADSPTADSSEWTAHPKNPVFNDETAIRPAGRPDTHDNTVDLFMQDASPGGSGGTYVRQYRATTLTTTEFDATEVNWSPVLGPSSQEWNGERMHHIDIVRGKYGNDIAVVDGLNADNEWSIGVYGVDDAPEPTLLSAGYRAGDWQPLEGKVILVESDISTSDTSWINFGNGNRQRFTASADNYPHSEFAVSISGRIRCDTADATYELRDRENDPSISISVVGSTADSLSSDIVSIGTASGAINVALEHSVDDSTATGTTHTVRAQLWGKL